MAFDPVPWFVEGGAQHSAEVARLLAHIATGGGEGILNATDMRVQPLSIPANRVRVMPGVCAIRNRALGSENQSYMARMMVEDELEIPASGSAGPRTHLVIARVENPHISGEPWGTPPDLETGPYIYPRVVPDVPIITRSVHELGLAYSAISLARITVPANTATITSSMITDLRGLINPITGPQPNPDPDPPGENEPCPEVTEKQYFDVKNHPGDATFQELDLSSWASATWHNWPAVADWIIPVPPWATGADVVLTLSGIQQRDGGTWGRLRVSIDNNAVTTTPVSYDFTSDEQIDGWTRHTLMAASTVAIPASMRGVAKRFRCQGRADGLESDRDAHIRWTRGAVAILQVVFKATPVFN